MGLGRLQRWAPPLDPRRGSVGSVRVLNLDYRFLAERCTNGGIFLCHAASRAKQLQRFLCCKRAQHDLKTSGLGSFELFAAFYMKFRFIRIRTQQRNRRRVVNCCRTNLRFPLQTLEPRQHLQLDQSECPALRWLSLASNSLSVASRRLSLVSSWSLTPPAASRSSAPRAASRPMW